MKARVKFGFATFIKTTNPVVHPVRPKEPPPPFDMATQLTTATEGLFVYLTPMGHISSRVTPVTTQALFTYYLPNNIVKVYIPEQSRFVDIPLFKLHIRGEVAV